MLTGLKDIRDNHHFTMEQMSKKIGISKSYYSMLEKGERNLSYDLAVKIASVFNKKPDDIFLQSKSTDSKQ